MDVGILRIVVLALSVICILCLGGVVFLSAMDKEPPVALGSAATVCIGALVGILATPKKED